MAKRTIAPELQEQLAEASAKDPVEAMITLHPGPGRDYIPSEDVGPQVEAILDEVGREVGETHEDSNVFENLGSFVVRARPAFLKVLLKRPEVATAQANRQGQDMLIRPVRKGPKPKG